MLEFFRRNVGGLLGIVIVAVLSLAFALSFGTQSQGWGKGQSMQYAATVNGEKIPDKTLSYAFRLLGGQNLDPKSAEYFKRQSLALDGLIERQLLVDMAEEMGISASAEDAEDSILKSNVLLSNPLGEMLKRIGARSFIPPTMVSQALIADGHKIPIRFKKDDGKFDIEMYKNYVRYNLGMTEEKFVEQQRLELIALRMRQMIAGTAQVSSQEVKDLYNRSNDTATIKFIRVIPSQIADKLSPGQEAFNQFAANNKDAIQKYYESHAHVYKNQDKQVRARHILIKAGQDAKNEEKDAAKAKLVGLVDQIKAGGDFAALAKEFSEDKGSAVKGGDLGFNSKGKMVPAFDEAMFKTEKGALSEIIETPYGYHVIKVEDVRDAGDIPLEAAQGEIVEKLFKEQRAASKAKEVANSLLQKLKNKKDIDAVIGKNDETNPYGLRVTSSRSFKQTDKSIPGVGIAPELINDVFAADEETTVFDKVYDVMGSHFVVALDSRDRPSDEEFEKQKDEIGEKIMAQKQIAILTQTISNIYDDAKKAGRIEEHGKGSSNNTPVVDAKEKDIASQKAEKEPAKAEEEKPADEPKADAKPEEKPAAEPKADAKPEEKPAAEPKADAKPEEKPAAEPKADAKPEEKPAAEPKADPKPVAAEPKADPKPVAAEPKADHPKPVAAEPKPQPKADAPKDAQ